MNSLVSILIPNYNKAPFLRETLDSILAQTYPHWECIIVDDGSTDNSWEILNEYISKDTRFKIFKRPDYLPKGGNAARNYAFELSSGQFVNWFDSDDLMKIDFIQTKLLSFKIKSVDAVISQMYKFDNGIEVETNWIPSFQDPIEDYLLKNIQFLTSGPMITRSFLENKLLFNEDIKVGQEKEFFFRLLCEGMRFTILNSYLGVYYERKDSILDVFNNKELSFEHLRYRYCIIESLLVYNLNLKNIKSLINLWSFKILIVSLKEFKVKYSLKMLYVLIRNKIYV